MLPVITVCAFALPLGAAAETSPPPRIVSWADLRHGWAQCVPNFDDLCSTEDGGKNWDRIFSCCNDIGSYARTSPKAGVVEAGYRIFSAYWTSTNGREWNDLSQIPVVDWQQGDRAIVLAGRGSLLFRAQGNGLNRIAGWPHPPFDTEGFATTDRGEISVRAGMRIVDGGVAALVTALSANGSEPPVSVLVHRARRGLPTRVVRNGRGLRLPSSRGCGRITSLDVAWPELYVAAGRAMWWSSDGGKTWAASGRC